MKTLLISIILFVYTSAHASFTFELWNGNTNQPMVYAWDAECECLYPANYDQYTNVVIWGTNVTVTSTNITIDVSPPYPPTHTIWDFPSFEWNPSIDYTNSPMQNPIQFDKNNGIIVDQQKSETGWHYANGVFWNGSICVWITIGKWYDDSEEDSRPEP